MAQSRSVTPGWRAVGMCSDGEAFDLGGVNPWDYEWVNQQEPIVVTHPLYPSQRHDIDVWMIHADGHAIRFAAGEMSALAWAFFVPADS